MQRAEKRKYHYIYKTTCIVTNRFYIGMHSTDNLEDGYVGSGMLLWKSIRKHGKANHTTEILEFLPSREALKLREAQLVNEELLGEKLCMNLQLGGGGGFENVSFEVQQDGRKKGAKMFWKRMKEDVEFSKHMNDLKSAQEFRNKISKGLKKFYLENDNHFKGKNHTEETKQLISKIHKENEHQKGEKNSQFGTMWISNIETFESKRVNKNFIFEAPWVIGRNAWNSSMPIEKKLKIAKIKKDESSIKTLEKKLEERLEKSKERENNKALKNLEKQRYMSSVVEAYNEVKSLRVVSEKFNISHIAVRGWIKKYEIENGVSILKTHGK